VSRYLVATRSAHKAREIRRILRDTQHLELITLADLGVPETPAEDALEVAATFLENARAKALYFAQLLQYPTLADDSGLEVQALGNQPGVRTRRFALDAGRIGLTGDALDSANNELLLERLQGIPAHRRAARYVCAAVLATPDLIAYAALGCCTGSISFELRGEGGFGYDPLFLVSQSDLTFAQLSPSEKDQRSHRARAFRALANMLSV
jgi:XTP/dITP diphosphohydrolase